MASTITEVANIGGIGGGRTLKVVTGNLGTYATNGVAIAAADCKLSRIDAVIAGSAGGLLFEWVSSTGKLKAYWNGDATPAACPEVTNSTNITTTVFTAIVIGLP